MNASVSSWLALTRMALLLAAALVMESNLPALEIKPIRHELREERQWLEQHLLNCNLPPSQAKPIAVKPASLEPGLDVFANNDAVTQNSRGQYRMKIGDDKKG